MKRLIFSVLLSLGMVLIAGRAFSQVTNSTGPAPTTWPSNPPVGIGTQLSIGGPQNALHINFNHADGHSDTAILRLSIGDTTTSSLFGILGLMPGPYDTAYSSLSRGADLILHENTQGDLILTNYQSTSLTHPYGAIRFATTPRAADLPLIPPPVHDYERMTILGNGNVGIDLPPDTSMTGLGNPKDQLQLGGGSTIPGLTFYGGNPFEGKIESDGVTLYPTDWRGISFNHYENHISGVSSRFKPIASSGIAFSEGAGGLLNFSCYPYDTSRGMTNFSKALTLQLTGNAGLGFWLSDTTAYHHLFDILIPGDTAGGIRNTNGLTFIHTPLCISSDHVGDPLINFTNLAGVHPDMGDGLTWTLVVNGPELAKEVFVLDSTWADYVFDPDYKLPSLGYVENYIKENHHLPDIEPASKIAKTGVPVGRMEEELTKTVEELTLRIIDQNKKIEQLEADIQELKNRK